MPCFSIVPSELWQMCVSLFGGGIKTIQFNSNYSPQRPLAEPSRARDPLSRGRRERGPANQPPLNTHARTDGNEPISRDRTPARPAVSSRRHARTRRVSEPELQNSRTTTLDCLELPKPPWTSPVIESGPRLPKSTHSKRSAG